MIGTSPIARRRHLLLGAAGLAIAAAVALPAAAQSVPATGIVALGKSVVATDQNQSNAAVTASARDPIVQASGAADGSVITVSGNVVSASARANKAVATLAPDALDPGAAFMGSSLATGGAGTNAFSPAVIATRQAADRTSVASSVSSPTTGARIGAMLGDVSASSVSVGGNTEEAIALANDASGSLSLTGAGVAGGAGIVSDQATTGNTAVTAIQSGAVGVQAASVTGSDLALTGNLSRALAYGSSATNALAVDAPAIAALPSFGAPATIPAFAGDPSVHAGYAVLSDQRLAGPVTAIDNGGIDMRVLSTAAGTSLTNASNSLIAAGYGNQSANSLTLSAAGVTEALFPASAVANVTNVQQVAAVPVRALAAHGSNIGIDGNAIGVNAGLKNNSVVAIATGNQADGNKLSITGGSIATGVPGGNGEGGGGVPVAVMAVGTAVADASGAMSVTAPFSVVNDQSSQGTIAATVYPAATSIAIGGTAVDSRFEASGNMSSAAATGNSGGNGLTLDGASLATAADLNSLQADGGNVTATIGSASAPGGVTIVAGAGVERSSLAVSGNSLTGNATGNRVVNTLAVTVVDLTKGSGHIDAEAGATSAGLGAATDYALANNQQLGNGSQLPVTIAANVRGAFGIATSGSATGSALVVSNNDQAALALGNGASNTLSLTAADLGGAGGPAPGSALSSLQVGQGNIQAASAMTLAVPGAAGSSVGISGNSNTVTARMNVADNALSVDAAHIGALDGRAFVEGDLAAIGEAVGDHVIANNQTATGSVVASASTSIAPGAGALNGSTASISGNQTDALAAANTAINGLTLTSASGTSAAGGVGNFQQNDAGVTARASVALAGGPTAMLNAQQAVTGNVTMAEAQGNSASNTLTLAGGSAFGGMPDLAFIATGPLNAASGPAVLSNVQANAGRVTAVSVGPNTPTGAMGIVDGSSMELTGNTTAATAYGNSATNAVTGMLLAAAIANTQANTGQVTAQVVSVGYAVAPWTVSAARIGITGNTASAQAVGNYAASTISANR